MALTTQNNMLSVNNLGCIRGERVLFKNLSFDLNSGKLLYVQGENGSVYYECCADLPSRALSQGQNRIVLAFARQPQQCHCEH